MDQRTVSNWFKACEGVEVYVDDILVHAETKAELTQRLTRGIADHQKQKS